MAWTAYQTFSVCQIASTFQHHEYCSDWAYGYFNDGGWGETRMPEDKYYYSRNSGTKPVRKKKAAWLQHELHSLSIIVLFSHKHLKMTWLTTEHLHSGIKNGSRTAIHLSTISNRPWTLYALRIHSIFIQFVPPLPPPFRSVLLLLYNTHLYHASCTLYSLLLVSNMLSDINKKKDDIHLQLYVTRCWKYLHTAAVDYHKNR